MRRESNLPRISQFRIFKISINLIFFGTSYSSRISLSNSSIKYRKMLIIIELIRSRIHKK